MSGLVTLIMPVWRPRSAWLREAVESALAEDDCEIELLVVDDGNPEPVAPLLAGIDDPRMRVLRIEHAGPYGARNAALAHARGHHVRFVDADDVVEPGSTGRLLARAAGEEVLAYGATVVCDEELVPRATHTSDVEGDAAAACVAGGFDVFVVSILFPRAVIDRAGGWEAEGFTVSGDWDFVLRALEQAPVRRLDAVVTRYRRHAGSVTSDADLAAAARAGEMVVRRYFERHPHLRGGPLEHRAYTRLHVGRALDHAARGALGPATRHLARAARHDRLAALRAGASIARTVSGRAARRVARGARTPA